MGAIMSLYRRRCVKLETVLSEEQITMYQDSTYFHRRDIIRLHRRFQDIDHDQYELSTRFPLDVRVPHEKIIKMPEFRENPFAGRICVVFSGKPGTMNFSEFLSMLSVFSASAARDIKCMYAFKIYDFDGDQHLGREDLEQVIKAITRNAMTPDEIEYILTAVIEEADVDDDDKLSYSEFQNIVSRAPNFANTFRIAI